jgi:excisionase family DNA binding protein
MKYEDQKQVVRPRVAKIGEAATMLAVCEKTVRRLVDRGKLRRIQGIRRVLIPLSEIEKFLAG